MAGGALNLTSTRFIGFRIQDTRVVDAMFVAQPYINTLNPKWCSIYVVLRLRIARLGDLGV